MADVVDEGGSRDCMIARSPSAISNCAHCAATAGRTVFQAVPLALVFVYQSRTILSLLQGLDVLLLQASFGSYPFEESIERLVI